MKLTVYSRWEENRDEAFLALLDYDPHAEVVDLGCGDGKFSVKIKKKIGCKKIWGIDVSDETLKKNKEEEIIVKKADLNNTLPIETNFFDIVVSNQVIEHLFYPVQFMKEVYRILKPGGYAVISTENLASWDNVVALLFGNTPFSMEFDCGLRKIGNPWSPHEKELKESYANSHVRIFAWNGLVALSRFSLFKVEKVSGNGNILGKLGEIMDKKHCRFITLKLRKVKDDER